MGVGEDVVNLGDQERAALRQQAHDWLRADLSALGPPTRAQVRAARVAVQSNLRHWQSDADLAGVRDRAGLAKLPATDRAAWEKLWSDVMQILEKARTK